MTVEEAILYSEYETQDGTTIRHAVAMPKGLRPGTGPAHNNQGIYEAIVLYKALRELGRLDDIDNINVFPLRPSQPT